MDLKTFKFFAFVAFVILLTYGTGAGFIYFLNRKTCLTKGERMKMSASYGVYQGCMVETKTGWVPLDQVRVVQ